MGAEPYQFVVDALSEDLKTRRNLERLCAVEIGSERGDGSTSFLNTFFNRYAIPFYSVDCEKSAWRSARALLGARACLMTGEAFFESHFPQLNRQLICVYLDNFDWTYSFLKESFIKNQKKAYRRRGIEMSNEQSQRAHLKQAQWAAHFAAPGCLVMMDDSWPRPDGSYDGKGGLAAPFLIENGFEQFDASPPADETDDGFIILKKPG